ncbi:TolB family protein [Chitinophaga qingshengii]|uniref:PD40 domain-containing protein n=1 Tax=Chitinophaga qingshengii TaxID=1569794 RepID=A0ABR7TRP8_9BACT|nr:PD40 domain-containing protein [Chitinophaga qingshengii]MBC9933158.1 PD40 domain-containing protein [Chitinophaga qingshengii]
MKTRVTTLVCLAVLLLTAACGKKDNPGPGNNGGWQLPGSIYYDWSEGSGLAIAYRLDLSSGVRSKAVAYNAKRHAWDISRDGSIMLQSLDDPNDYDGEIYRIINMQNGQTLSEFRKKNSEVSNFTEPLLSPDKSLIAVPPTFDRGLIVMDLQGRLLKEVVTIGGKKVKGNIAWMPDNSIICVADNIVYRLNNQYTWGDVVTQLNFNDWNHITASYDGQRLAFGAGKHIWMMNADGTNKVQVTTSNDEEGYPVFSPDGKHLLMGTDYEPESSAIRNWILTIIPADGRQYNVTEGADDRVVMLKVNGSDTRLESSDGAMEWR